MSRTYRPPEPMNATELASFTRDLELAPLLVVRKLYEDTHERCHLAPWTLPTPRDMQEMVAAWKVLRKRARQPNSNRNARRDGGIFSRTT